MNQEDQANQVRYFIYLDGLRESGKTNMFGAVPYLIAELSELSSESAQVILVNWMKRKGIQER